MSSASRDVPWRNRWSHPSVDRVPSGNTMMFHPSPISSLALLVAFSPAPRSTGNPAYTSAVNAERHHTSKK
jgi:hypothetical protein